MSADKGKTILIGFAGLAIVLVATIALVSPKFINEDAMGAIGAVQKHRAPQISPTDLIPGAEQTHQQQQLLYADFLADAAALQSVSANIATAPRAESAGRLQARSQELQARYLAAAKAQVENMKDLVAGDKAELAKIETIESDIDSAGTRVQSTEAIDSLDARLRATFSSLRTLLSADDPSPIEAGLAALGTRVDGRHDLEAARSTLAAAMHALEARSIASAMIRARASYLEAMAKECFALQSAEASLSTGSRAPSILLDEAQELARRALVAMKSNLESQTAAADSLGRMRALLDTTSRTVESRSNTYSAASLAGFRTESAALSGALVIHGREAQARAAAEMRGQLTHISNYLGSVRNLDTRAAARANIAEFAAQLQRINHAAETRAVYATVLSDSREVASTSPKSPSQ